MPLARHATGGAPAVVHERDLDLALLTDRPAAAAALVAQLRLVGQCLALTPDMGVDARRRFDAVIVDLDLGEAASRDLLARVLESRPETPMIVLTRNTAEKPAYTAARRRTMFLSEPGAAGPFANLVASFVEPGQDAATLVAERSVRLTADVIGDVLSRDGGRSLSLAKIAAASDHLLDALDLSPLARWLGAVKAHHRGTFLHCLTVAGTMATFVNALGFPRADRARLLSGALVHDVGKAKIPLAILDKPGRLDPDEIRIMRTHAAEGHRILVDLGETDRTILDMTRHHHELLDGTGYPDGLRGPEIADPIRILTICDVFAALTEERSYKPSFDHEEALRVLAAMEAELDQALVAAFTTALGASSRD